MSCVDLGDGATLCRPGELREYRRESAGTKWCFKERKHLPHDLVLTGEAGITYYDPWWHFECSSCKGDHTLFPGYSRAWSED